MHKFARIIIAVPMQSCALDPLPTHILKEFLQELPALITGCLPVSQCHAITTPRLQKVLADQADVKNCRPISNVTFAAEVVEKLVCRQLVSFLRLALAPSGSLWLHLARS